MKNAIEQSLNTIRALANGIDPNSGEEYAADSPYKHHKTIQALNSAIKALDNSLKIAERVQQGNLPSSAGKPWNADEEEKLIHLFDCGMSLEELAQQHGRTELGISSRLVKLGKLESRC